MSVLRMLDRQLQEYVVVAAAMLNGTVTVMLIVQIVVQLVEPSVGQGYGAMARRIMTAMVTRFQIAWTRARRTLRRLTLVSAAVVQWTMTVMAMAHQIVMTCVLEMLTSWQEESVVAARQILTATMMVLRIV